MKKVFIFCVGIFLITGVSNALNRSDISNNKFLKCTSYFDHKEYQKVLTECDDFKPNTGGGYGVSNLMIGLIYEHGLSVPKNYKKAVKHLQIAADKNLPEAQYDLAMIYAKGIDVKKDDFKAIQLLKASEWAEKSKPSIKSRTILNFMKKKEEAKEVRGIGVTKTIISISKEECEKIGGVYHKGSGDDCFDKNSGNYINTIDYAFKYKGEY